MADLDISNIINVTLQGTPEGLSERNVNSLALFTTETPGNVDSYRSYVNAQSVTDDYGTNSVTADMANAIFAQTPNIRSGDGRLVIIPLQGAVSATVGDFTTADISANLTNIYSVTDGDLRVTLNGTNIDLTGITFAGASSIDDVASVLQAKLKNVAITVVGNTLKFESKKVGLDSDVVLAAVAGGTGTDLSAAGYLNAAGGTATSGANASGETIEEAITRIGTTVDYFGIITDLYMEDDVINDLSDFIQARDNMFIHQFSSTEDIAGIGSTIEGKGNRQTRCLLYTNSVEDANLFKAAYAGRGYSVLFRGSRTVQTLQLKQLATITADANINQTEYENAETAGMDMYVSFRGRPGIESTGGNDYFDNVYVDFAYKFALQVAGFNYLAQTNTKVPQTEQGMEGLKAAYNQVNERFVRNGAIGVGLAWNSSETFGDPETFKANITERGYYTYSLPIAQQDQTEREQRKAPLVQIALKRAGAIHRSTVVAVVED